MTREEPRRARPRYKLSGLEGPEELLDRLHEASAEVETLAARNEELARQVDTLRRQLRSASELRDEELVAELPRRMTHSLAAAQEVAAEIVERARNEAIVIRLNGDQAATQVLDRAKAESARIVRDTQARAQAHLAATAARAKELVRATEARRAQIEAQLDERANRMEHDWQRMHEDREDIEQALLEVAALVDAARAALVASGDEPGRTDREVMKQEVAPRESSRNQDRADGPRMPPRGAEAPDVFDWSGVNDERPRREGPAGTTPMLRSVAARPVDAVAG